MREVLARRIGSLAAALTACGLGAALLAPAASASTQTLGSHGWQVQSTANVKKDGASVSSARFSTTHWLHVKPDSAGAVGTEIEALVQNGRCPNVFYGTNLKRCFGYMNIVGPETVPQFAVPWWFRTSFTASGSSSTYDQLIINGVVGSADVWVNGHEVATHRSVQGDFARYTFKITKLVHKGKNVVALKLYPNDPNKVLTLDDVDWSQIPPDNNTGIQFPIQLHSSGPLSLSNAHVVQNDNTPLTDAQLTLKGDVTNNGTEPETGTVNATVSSPSGAPIAVSRSVTVGAGKTAAVEFTPTTDPALNIENPAVWWPYQLGSQPLYGFKMSVTQAGFATDSESEQFGIRTITTKLIGATKGKRSKDFAGSRQFYVNGKPVMFRGGGWSENLLLHYSASNTAQQIELIKNLGLNGIRTEGKQMPANFYNQMDKAGILIDAGFQCCDLWDPPSIGAHPTAEDYRVMANSSYTIGQNLRNHPSIMNFGWSDDAPTKEQDKVSLPQFKRADFQEPIIASAEYNAASGLGRSGEKEGPYDWVPPGYWYDTKQYVPGDPTRTNVGGAWAFDSEAGSGATIPTMDFIKRWLTTTEQKKLWTSPNYNQYHLNYENGLPSSNNGGYAFGTLHDLDKAMKARYGAWHSLAGYVEDGQLANYEDVRAQFEAYINNSNAKVAPSTGIDYWQLNKGWPTLLWALYNYDLNQSGAYFGAQEANTTLHAIYNYNSGNVSVSNLTGTAATGLSVQANVYNIAGNRLWHGSRDLNVSGLDVAHGLLHPKVPATTKPPQKAKTYFVQLVLSQNGKVVNRNTYWMSTQKDVVNWKKTLGQPQATMKQYANLQQLHKLKRASVKVSASSAPGPGGQEVTSVTITNTSKNKAVAFFLRADLRRGSAAGVPDKGNNLVAPVQWSGNDISLWPGESQTLTASYSPSQLRGQHAVVSFYGWNARLRDVKAGG